MRRFILLAALLVSGCTHHVQNASDPHEDYYVFFETNSDELTPDGYAIVQHAAQAVHQLHPASVVVSGYSDRQGSEAENHQIAKGRTLIVQKTLVDLGVNAKIIYSLPLGAADDDLGPTGDRRIEISLLANNSLMPPNAIK